MKLQGKRVLITGAGGFLGRAFCRVLSAEGALVQGSLHKRPLVEGIVPYPWSLEQPEEAWPLVEASNPSHVVHLAAPVNLNRDPNLKETMQRQIVEATEQLALACEDRGIPLLVAGTCEEYGDQMAPFSEDMPTAGVSPYSRAKAQSTRWLLERHRSHGLRVCVVRPFLTYGPEQRSSRLIPTAIHAALKGSPFPTTNGEQTREFNYITDMALGLRSAMSPQAEGELLNLGGGEEVPVRKVLEHIFALANADPKLIQFGALAHREGEAHRFFGDHSKTQRLLQHRPKIALQDGLRATMTWWRRLGRLSN
jgi:nucleoside-diphosphate-sugar epimerase